MARRLADKLLRLRRTAATGRCEMVEIEMDIGQQHALMARFDQAQRGKERHAGTELRPPPRARCRAASEPRRPFSAATWPPGPHPSMCRVLRETGNCVKPRNRSFPLPLSPFLTLLGRVATETDQPGFRRVQCQSNSAFFPAGRPESLRLVSCMAGWNRQAEMWLARWKPFRRWRG